MDSTDQSKKIDKIFSIVSLIQTDVAVIKERDANTDKKLNSHDGKIAAIEDVINEYHIEKAKSAVVNKAAFFIVGIIGAIIGTATGGILVVIVTHYLIK